MNTKQITLMLLLVLPMLTMQAKLPESGKTPQRIFIYGGDIELKFVEYVCNLMDKPEPRICYLPTASADSPNNIKYWESICGILGIKPYVMKVWVDSRVHKQSFEDILLSMDAIVPPTYHGIRNACGICL